MATQTTVRLPDDLADDAEAVARVRGGSVKKLLERDREILDRLAK